MKLPKLLAAMLTSALMSPSVHACQAPGSPNDNIRLAVDIVCTVSSSALEGYFVVPLRRNEWPLLISDGDIGPFLTAANKDTNSLVIIIPKQATLPTFAVYFLGQTPTMVSVIPPDVKKLTSQRVISSFIAVPATIKSCACGFSYEQGSLTADNGIPVHTYEISVNK